MNEVKRQSARLGVLLLVGALLGCGSNPKGEGSGAEESTPSSFEIAEEGAPLVMGTALEASTGTPLAGVLIEGPGGLRTETDQAGRFVLKGLQPGQQGEIRATGPDGLAGANRLRPLKGGQLEVVIYLR